MALQIAWPSSNFKEINFSRANIKFNRFFELNQEKNEHPKWSPAEYEPLHIVHD